MRRVGGAFNVLIGSEFTLTNSRLKNISAAMHGGIAAVNSGCNLTMDGVTMDGASAGTFGGAFWSEGNVILKGNTQLVNSRAATSSGGAIFLSTSGTVLLDGTSVVVSNNTAATCGGAIYAGQTTGITLGSNVLITGNKVTADSTGDAMCLQQSSLAPLVKVTSTGSAAPTINGNVWVADSTYAKALQDSGVFSQVKGTLITRGGATHLAYVGTAPAANRSLQPGEALPSFKFKALDAFGQTANVISLKPVIVRVLAVDRSTGLNVTVKGENTKAILDTDTNAVTFDGLSIPALPGSYAVYAKGLEGTIDMLPGDNVTTWFNFTVASCNPLTEKFVASVGACLPYLTISTGLRLAMGVIAVICFVGTVVAMAMMWNYREFKVVKANSPLFVIIACFGSLIAYFAVIFSGFIVAPWVCFVRIWTENLGFFMVVTAVILKTRRIQLIFTNKTTSTKKFKDSLKDQTLLRYLAFVMVCVVGFCVIWSIQEPPTPVESVLYGTYIDNQKCKGGSLELIMKAARIIAQLLYVYLAYSIRDVPSSFNESRIMSFASYNWLFFGLLLSTLVDFIIDPNVSFVVYCMSILIPHAVSVILLCGLKVFRVVSDPIAANADTLHPSQANTANTMKNATRITGATGLASGIASGTATSDANVSSQRQGESPKAKPVV